MSMGTAPAELYFVFMIFDREYERLRGQGTKQQGALDLDLYLSRKHDGLLSKLLEPNTYKKRFSMNIVDGFAVEMTEGQANLVRSAKEVRIVEKNQEID